MTMMKRFLFLGILFLSGCAPSSPEEYCFEGEGAIRKIVEECKKVHSKEDLLLERPKIKRNLMRLTDLMIAAKKFQMKNPEEEVTLNLSQAPSNQLKEEFLRIYKIEGCREIMEEMERESLHKLDAFNQKTKFLYAQKKH
jgi:hypothetical protein